MCSASDAVGSIHNDNNNKNNNDNNNKDSNNKSNGIVNNRIVAILNLVAVIFIVGYANIKWAESSIRNNADSVQYKSSRNSNNNNNDKIITSNNYFDDDYTNNPVYQEQIIIANRSSLSLPEQVLMQYIQQHSHQSLLQNPNNRTFIIGYYYCPQQAGNRMHDFVASLIFGIAMNRTLLWKYMDKPTCDQMAKVYNKSVTTAEHYYGDCRRTTINDCNQILQRASWIPSFDEWIPKLLSSSYLSLNDTQLRPRVERLPQDIGPNATQQVIFNMPKYNAQVNFSRREFVEILGPDFVKNNPIVQKLYTQGVDYVQGMMFHYSFQLQNHLIPPEYNNNNNDIIMNQNNLNKKTSINDEFSLFVHSRHINDQQDGSDIDFETTCLNRLMEHYTPKKYNSCKVYLLSDRNITLNVLSDLVQHFPNRTKQQQQQQRRLQRQVVYNKTYCTPVIASHQANRSYMGEHGPFAGAGFYQDIIMASQARNGWIGSCRRSSTELVRELTEYKRQQQWQQQVNDINNILPPMLNCCWNMRRTSILDFESLVRQMNVNDTKKENETFF